MAPCSRMGLRQMGSVTGVAPWVMVGDTLALAGLLWSGESGVWCQGLGPGSGARGQGEGHGSRSRAWCKGLVSGFGMWHLGPGSGLGFGAGIKIWVRVQGLRSGVKVWALGFQFRV